MFSQRIGNKRTRTAPSPFQIWRQKRIQRDRPLTVHFETDQQVHFGLGAEHERPRPATVHFQTDQEMRDALSDEQPERQPNRKRVKRAPAEDSEVPILRIQYELIQAESAGADTVLEPCAERPVMQVRRPAPQAVQADPDVEMEDVPAAQPTARMVPDVPVPADPIRVQPDEEALVVKPFEPVVPDLPVQDAVPAQLDDDALAVKPIEQVVPELPAQDAVTAQPIANAMPAEPLEPPMPEILPILVFVAQPETPPRPITKENSLLLSFVREALHHPFRDGGEDDVLDGETSMGGTSPAPIPAKHDCPHARNDSVIDSLPPKDARSAVDGRMWRAQHRPVSHAQAKIGQHLLSASNKDELKRMIRDRKISAAEVSLRTEIRHQERFLSRHEHECGQPRYEAVRDALEKNRGHLRDVRPTESWILALPESVRARLGHIDAYASQAAVVGAKAGRPGLTRVEGNGFGQVGNESESDSDEEL